uniref:Cytochrome b5 heme-binding domain-containing protein n=1 Tax=Clastoptera arizonana TaxID=38151 RepID=A0A1B6DBJ9_9HEMI
MGYADEGITIKYLGKEYDVTKFKKFHPGGSNTLTAFKGLDITKQFIETEHSPAAYSLLKEYDVKEETEEDLVDWSKSLYKQVGQLGKNYHSWVLNPVDKKARLFDSDLLEQLTITQWYVVPIFWVPIILGLTYSAHLQIGRVAENEGTYVLNLLGSFLFGFFLWPLFEYAAHRWIFHLKPPDDWPFLISLHFGLHGLHHKVPFDERRLLFPPAPAAVIAFIVYCVYSVIFPAWAVPAIGAGSLTGYVMYDLIHYYLHYGSPKEGTYFYFMKRYHNQHHFVHHNQGFGISNNFWDKIFSTGLTLKKLKFNMKW